MMKRPVKIAITVLLAITMAATFAGCGGNDEGYSSCPASSAPVEAADDAGSSE